MASRPLSVQSLGLATERDTFLAQGLSSAVTQTLQSARAPSTRALYSYRWETFKTWCIRRNECPRSGSLTSVLEFLQELFEQGKSPSTLKVFLAAISACHERIDGKTVGANPLSIQFLKGAQRLRPRRLPSVPAWQLNVVLQELTKSPFEPLADVDIEWLSLKVAFLLAVTSAKRIGELHALSVHADCFYVKPDGTGIVLCPNPAFVPKILTAQNLNQVIALDPFHPPPFGSEEDETLSVPSAGPPLLRQSYAKFPGNRSAFCMLRCRSARESHFQTEIVTLGGGGY